MRRVLIAVIVGLALCASVPAFAKAPTRAEYISTLDPMCQKTDRKLNEPTDEFTAALDRGKFRRAARFLAVSIDIFAKSLDRLARVEPPAADVNRISRWLSLENQDVDVGRRMVEVLGDGDTDAYDGYVRESRDLERRIDATLRGYGFKHCN